MKIENNMIVNGNMNTYGQKEVMTKRSGEENVMKEEKQNDNGHFPGESQLIEVIEKSNKDLKMTNTSLKFSIHEKTKQIMVKVVNNETQEVIREIPPEKILDMVAAMLERTGLFVDKKA